MTLRQYLFLMLATTAMCWLGFGAVVRVIDPVSGGWMAVALFYASLALALSGTFATGGALVRAHVRRHEPAARHVSAALRQSLILTSLVIAALVLQSRGGLTWPRLILLIGIASLIEVFLASLSGKKTKV